MDFVVQNVNTGKYFCVIEVKRTPADIHSTRYQYQAMSYVEMNYALNEKPYYILTNLEKAFTFRFDAGRLRVFQQMLKPGLISIGDFSEEREVFIYKLSEFFKAQFESFFNDDYEYLVTLGEFASHMEMIKNDSKKWKSHMAMFLYEYIRGAFRAVNRGDLPDIRVFRNDIERICDEAARVNFKDIFTYSEETYENPTAVDGALLSDLYDFGLQNVSGDSIANVLHQIVSQGHEHDGEVPTDLELAGLVGILAKNISGDISEPGLLCDPAAGSGNLLSAAANIYNLAPDQILANDCNAKLVELLSLRLGLNFASQINTTNSPKITNENVAFLNSDYFADVKVIVMNPPFVAGINCVGRKQIFYSAINEITGGHCKTNTGQMPLEAVFLELITNLVRPGTVIACVLPKTHLTARGYEAKAIRKLIVENLGVRIIFNYPGDDIFNDVTKDTCVVVGKAMRPVDTVKVFSAYENIPDIDAHRFQQAVNGDLSDEFDAVMPGVVAGKIATDQLLATIDDGWRSLNSEMVEGIRFVKSYIVNSGKFAQLKDFNFTIKRGGAGNKGASDLLFFDTRTELYSRYVRQNIVLKAGMRNAKLRTFIVGDGDSKFLDIAANNEDLVEDIIQSYLLLPSREGRQQRKSKTAEELKGILNYESRNAFVGNSVLIPRAIRREGKVYLSEAPVFVSTNFIVCTTNTPEEAILLSTWVSTIFYQLICEVASKDQEGMRKMEVADILATFVPLFNNVTDEFVEKLEAEKDTLAFVDLKYPVIRNVDRIWAEYLFGDEGNEHLETAKRLLSFLANKRNS